MKLVQLNSTLEDVISSTPSLSSYLYGLEKGRPVTPHSWLYESETSEKTLRRWLPILEKANSNSEFSTKFNQFEAKQLPKFGPQGQIPPIKEALNAYEDSFSKSPYDDGDALEEYYPLTQSFAKELFGGRLRTKRRLSIESVLDDMRERDTLSTNSGMPLFTRREKVREQSIQDALSGKAYEWPAIALFRQYNGKLRGVWMFPMSMNLIESQFTQIIQETIRISPTIWVREYVSPWNGFDKVKKIATAQWGNFRIFGGDTTAMDAHMRLAQTTLVFHIVKWLFQEGEWPDLYKCMYHVNAIDLLVGRHTITSGLHGYSSGSGWTQLGETVLQMFMAFCLKTRGQGIGDDFFWLNTEGKSASYFVDFMSKFGLPAKEEKQSDEADGFSFLQRYFHKNFYSRESSMVLGGYYPTIRALNSSLNPEKFHKPELWNSQMFCARQFMILENCVDDPSFVDFVSFVCKGHKDLIPFAQSSHSEIDMAQAKSRLIPGFNPSYNQEKLLKPLSSFESIRIASML